MSIKNNPYIIRNIKSAICMLNFAIQNKINIAYTLAPWA